MLCEQTKATAVQVLPIVFLLFSPATDIIDSYQRQSHGFLQLPRKDVAFVGCV